MMKKKKKLIESLSVQIAFPASNVDIAIDDMLTTWGSTVYAELSLILASARYLQIVHQTNHWCSVGQNFYSDHLLFKRLYDDLDNEIDLLAEKSIGLGSIKNVDLQMQIMQIMKLSNGYKESTSTFHHQSLVMTSYSAEINFLRCISHCVDSLKQKNLLTRGLDNLLAGIEDKHEEHCYLLRQRIDQSL
jgi:DNA-binding ferritin-like protein